MSTKHKNTVTVLHILSEPIGIQKEYIFSVFLVLFFENAHSEVQASALLPDSPKALCCLSFN